MESERREAELELKLMAIGALVVHSSYIALDCVGVAVPLPPWRVCECLAGLPTSMMGSIRPRAVRPRQGIRQKASAAPEKATSATATSEKRGIVVERKFGWGVVLLADRQRKKERRRLDIQRSVNEANFDLKRKNWRRA